MNEKNCRNCANGDFIYFTCSCGMRNFPTYGETCKAHVFEEDMDRPAFLGGFDRVWRGLY